LARRQRALACLVLLLCASMALSGCGLWRKITGEDRRAKEAAAQETELRQRCERYSDTYSGRILESVGKRIAGSSDPEEYLRLAAWQVSQVNAAYTIATGESALACSLDFVVLATLSRLVVQGPTAMNASGDLQFLVKMYEDLEKEAWTNAEQVLTTAQEEELRAIIAAWRESNPEVSLVSFVRFADFAKASGWKPDVGHTGSLLSLIGIDPLEGLDPAVRQIEQTRLLAERAIFYMQRFPYLVDAQMQLAMAQAVLAPGLGQLFDDFNMAARSMEAYAEIGKDLPEEFAKERNALIQQLSIEFLAQQVELRGVLVDLQATLQAGSETAVAVDAAVRSIDDLMGRFPASGKKEDGESTKPFDITDYAAAAGEFTRTAAQLTDLVDVLGRESSQVAGLVEGSVLQGQALVDYMFRRALLLIGLVLLGILATVLAYRWISVRIAAGKG
jgi:hypothetical protein